MPIGTFKAVFATIYFMLSLFIFLSIAYANTYILLIFYLEVYYLEPIIFILTI